MWRGAEGPETWGFLHGAWLPPLTRPRAAPPQEEQRGSCAGATAGGVPGRHAGAQPAAVLRSEVKRIDMIHLYTKTKAILELWCLFQLFSKT